GDDTRLTIAKASFAFAGENIRDAAPCRRFDFIVRIDERPAELLGEQPAHRRLAGAAIANEKEVGHLSFVTVICHLSLAIFCQVRVTSDQCRFANTWRPQWRASRCRASVAWGLRRR